MFIVGWATCKEGTEYEISKLCYTLYFKYDNSSITNNEFPELVLRNYEPENDVNNSITKHLIQDFVDLRILNYFKKKCCGVVESKGDKLPLDPFNDETKESDLMETDPIETLYDQKIKENKKNVDFFSTEDERTNTLLQGERLCHYVTWFIIGFMLLATTAGVFFWLYYQQNKGRPLKYKFNLEIAALVIHAYSLFRVLPETSDTTTSTPTISTATASAPTTSAVTADPELDKVNYVRRYLEETDLPNVAQGKIITDDDAKKYLKKHDRHFIDTAVSTLSWLQLWFLLHWILYIISTFLIMSLLIEAIALHVKAKISHIEHGVGFHPGEIGFLFMYSVLECFFLLHPCLRAASVTRTRRRVIRKISDKASKEYNAIPGEVMHEFIESMKERKFSFRLRIMCASIPFNLNIAYISIAFAFVSVIVTLITTVTK
uniref:Uncharacterized protein n=1 Tax=Amphimedon queenslandica TaxID=400682 RepID=A0A1X7T802_AMPQE